MQFFQLPGQAEEIHSLYKRGYGKGWVEVISRFLALVNYLDADPDFAPQLVHTSHARLLFVQQNNPLHVLVVANAETHSQEKERTYEIKYRLASRWEWTVGYAGDVVTAKSMILEGLQYAYSLPIGGEAN